MRRRYLAIYTNAPAGIRTAEVVSMNGHNPNGRNLTLKPVRSETRAKAKSPMAEMT
jgi:hypothetical protein